jgi:hypothetical protein
MTKKYFTPMQQLFIAEYVLHKNATKAAQNAGYSSKTARSMGSRLLTNVYIMEAIEKQLAVQVKRAEISADRIIQELKNIAFADPLFGGSSNKLRALELLGQSLGIFQKPNETSSKPDSASMVLRLPNHSKKT